MADNPKEYQVHKPGGLVQVNTLDGRPLPGVVLIRLPWTAPEMGSLGQGRGYEVYGGDLEFLPPNQALQGREDTGRVS